MIKEIKGNIFDFENEWDAIAHGCNCFNTMGAGIARTIKERYPAAYKVDSLTKRGDKEKLGTITSIHCNNKWVINMYTQYSFASKGEDVFDYDAFRIIMKNLNYLIKHNYNKDYVLAMPKVGAGLAGGDWSKIRQIIEEQCKDINVNIYYL